jgi:hypothetical protein
VCHTQLGEGSRLVTTRARIHYVLNSISYASQKFDGYCKGSASIRLPEDGFTLARGRLGNSQRPTPHSAATIDGRA